MDYLADYWLYNSQYEIHRTYALWSGISLLGAVVNRHVYHCIGDLEVHGNLYTLLVGPQGNHKSVPCDFACNMFMEVCPDLISNIGASNQSAEDIVRTMSEEGFAKQFTNERGEPTLIAPYMFFINEFKNFIAYNPSRMLNFLTDIYDRKFYNSGTIIRGRENIINPCLNILACENTDQLIKFMRSDVITGGASRRFIIIHETEYAAPKPNITISPSAREAWNRVKNRLVEVRRVVGEFKMTPSGRKFYDEWYLQNHKEMISTGSSIMKGYLSTKNVQLIKICMLLNTVSDNPNFCLNDELLAHGLALLTSLEINMPRLFVASGRNELLGPQQNLLDFLRKEGGWMTEQRFRKAMETDFKVIEQLSMLRHLEDTGQLIKKLMSVPGLNGETREKYVYWLPDILEEKIKSGEYKFAKS